MDVSSNKEALGAAAPPGLSERTRGYQREMFEESLLRNIVVAMDTGSGKTHIAILRVYHELEKGNGKLCWFLVPSVTLGEQQFGKLRDALPPVHMQFLSGLSGVDKWSSKEIWDEILGAREALVVSTYQVLLDALRHGFVDMDRIGLLVFDEAHNCTESNPANRILQEFYHPCRRKSLQVPAVLGLTASPIISADPTLLRTMEQNIDAIAKTPTIHRNELLEHVHPPKLTIVNYQPGRESVPSEVNNFYPKVASVPSVPWTVSTSPAPFVPSAAPVAPALSNKTSLGTGFPSLPFKIDIDLGPEFEIPGLKGYSEMTSNAIPDIPTNPASSEVPTDDPSDSEYECIDIDIPPSPRFRPTLVINNQQVQVKDVDMHSLSEAKVSSSAGRGNNVVGVTIDDEYDHIDFLTGELMPANPQIENKGKPSAPGKISNTNLLHSLLAVYQAMVITEDPYYLFLLKGGPKKQKERDKVLLTGVTACHEQMKGLVNKATYIMDQFGAWAANWFVKKVVEAVCRVRRAQDDDFDVFEDDGDSFATWHSEEKQYIRNLMSEIYLPDDIGQVTEGMTHKATKLLKVLVDEYKEEKEGFSGLVFVQQRVGVVILSELIKEHPMTRDIFRVGTVVGSGYGTQRKAFLHDIIGKNQKTTLPDFHMGEKNLIIATSVLEEGIDVRSCHLVVCFDFAPNLKSFIQRRGRARRARSSYVILVSSSDSPKQVRKFEELEQEMISLYSDPTRELEDADDSGFEMEDDRVFRTTKGALLTLESAIPHLYHFCACVPTQEFVDHRPDFRTENTSNLPLAGKWRSEVILPNSIHPDIRRTPSKESTWPSEKSAKRDAAFEAFVKLHSLGLVDEHLMPLVKADLGNALEMDKKRPAKADVENTMDIWKSIGQYWPKGDVYKSKIQVFLPEGDVVAVEMLLPVSIPEVSPLTLHWTNQQPVKVTIGPSEFFGRDSELVKRGKRATYQLFENMFSTRFIKDRDDFPYLFIPVEGDTWDEYTTKAVNALVAYEDGRDMGVVRDVSDLVYVFRRWRTDIKPADIDPLREYDRTGQPIIQNQPIIECSPLLKRRDFGHKMDMRGQSKYKAAAYKLVQIIPQLVTVDTLPWRYSRLALLLPCIIDRIEKTILAMDLRASVLSSVPGLTAALVQHATAASSAQEPTNYERLEFLGDSVLKMLTSVSLMDENPLWHEGYLTGAKDRIVSNTASSRAAMKKILSRWIVTRPFTAQKWVPKYIGVLETDKESPKTELSTKTLADVVEALIGASYVSAGFEGAIKCCAAFELPVNWLPLETRVTSLIASASDASERLPKNLPEKYAVLEDLVGYKFKKKSLLLEAMTHLSYDAESSMSYQRLEFLGDAVLDMVIVHALYNFPGRELSHIHMHLHKSAVVNAHYLAYLCLSQSAEVERPVVTKTRGGEYSIAKTRHSLPLYKFLRSSHSGMPAADALCAKRYQKFKDQIKLELDTTQSYPWVALLRLDAPKHLSDIIESLVAAIWIDSSGSFDEVEAFLDRLGVIETLVRMVNTDMITEHPSSLFGKKVAYGGQSGIVKYHTTEEGETFSCNISVDDVQIFRVEKCVSRQEARASAAQAALKIIEERDSRGEDRGYGGKPIKPANKVPPAENADMYEQIEFFDAEEVL